MSCGASHFCIDLVLAERLALSLSVHVVVASIPPLNGVNQSSLYQKLGLSVLRSYTDVSDVINNSRNPGTYLEVSVGGWRASSGEGRGQSGYEIYVKYI